MNLGTYWRCHLWIDNKIIELIFQHRLCGPHRFSLEERCFSGFSPQMMVWNLAVSLLNRTGLRAAVAICRPCSLFWKVLQTARGMDGLIPLGTSLRMSFSISRKCRSIVVLTQRKRSLHCPPYRYDQCGYICFQESLVNRSWSHISNHSIYASGGNVSCYQNTDLLFLKLVRACCLAPWDLSPWMASALMPCFTRSFTMRLAPLFVRVNTKVCWMSWVLSKCTKGIFFSFSTKQSDCWMVSQLKKRA